MVTDGWEWVGTWNVREDGMNELNEWNEMTKDDTEHEALKL